MRSLGPPEILIVLAVCFLFAYGVFGRIFYRAGYPRWMGILIMIPLVNLLTIIWFAFAEWPALRREH